MTAITSVFVDGEELLGFIIYGLWRDASAPVGRIELGPIEEGSLRAKRFMLYGDGWEICLYEVSFDRPEHYWQAVTGIEEALERMLQAGARAAWLGSEGLPFADPPDLFKPEWMEGGVLLARTAGGARFGRVDRVGFEPLTNAEMERLDLAARGSRGTP